MTAKIARIYNEDIGEMLVVPGADPAQILEDAKGELDAAEHVFTSLEDIKVRWWRVSPCHPNSCYEGGGHHVHYEDCHGRTRGSFQAAGLAIGYRDEDDGP